MLLDNASRGEAVVVISSPGFVLEPLLRTLALGLSRSLPPDLPPSLGSSLPCSHSCLAPGHSDSTVALATQKGASIYCLPRGLGLALSQKEAGGRGPDLPAQSVLGSKQTTGVLPARGNGMSWVGLYEGCKNKLPRMLPRPARRTAMGQDKGSLVHLGLRDAVPG